MMRKVALLVFLMVFGSFAVGQIAVSCTTPQYAIDATSGGSNLLRRVPGATITVCAAGSSGVPCSPLSAVYNTSGFQIPNPFFAGADGKYQVCTANPGSFMIQISATGLPTTISDQVPIGIVTAANQAFTGNNSFTGNNVFMLPLSPSFSSIFGIFGSSGSYQSNVNAYPNIFIQSYDNTSSYNGTNKFPFANPVAGSSIRADMFAGPSNTDRMFTFVGHATCGTPAPNPNGLAASNDKVAGYFASHRFTVGACNITGLNTLVEGDPGSFLTSYEADVNVFGGDASLSNPWDVDGIDIASGGANKPRAGLSISANNAPTNAFLAGALIQGWTNRGVDIYGIAGQSATGIFMESIPPNATSLGTQTNSLDIMYQDNRWNGTQAVFDQFKQRLVPNSGGTDSCLYTANNGGVNIFGVCGAGSTSNTLLIGQSGLAFQLQGNSAFINWTSVGMRLTPTDDTAGTALSITNAANNTNQFTVSKAGQVQPNSYGAQSNCLLGGASGTSSPAACSAAPTGKIAIPASQTTYTINTSLVTNNSEIIIQQVSDNTGLPSSPTCNTTLSNPLESSRSAGNSFTFSLTSVANVTCYQYWIVN